MFGDCSISELSKAKQRDKDIADEKKFWKSLEAGYKPTKFKNLMTEEEQIKVHGKIIWSMKN